MIPLKEWSSRSVVLCCRKAHPHTRTRHQHAADVSTGVDGWACAPTCLGKASVRKWLDLGTNHNPVVGLDRWTDVHIQIGVPWCRSKAQAAGPALCCGGGRCTLCTLWTHWPSDLTVTPSCTMAEVLGRFLNATAVTTSQRHRAEQSRAEQDAA